jgi:hypothetical protein
MQRGIVLSIVLFVTLTLAAGAAVVTEAPTIEQLQANPELLRQLYQPAHSLTVEEYYFRGYLAPGEPQPEIVPSKFGTEDLYVVRNVDKVVYIKKDAGLRHLDLTFLFLPTNAAGAPVLCLPNPSGGNGWRANPWFVVLRDPLKLLGQVSWVGDMNGDEIQDLVVVDDIWESGWPQLSHAGAPRAAVFYHVENGALAVDQQKTNGWAWHEISMLNEKILQMRPNAAAAMARGDDAGDNPFFSSILEKFLYYRVLNRVDSGWVELKKDLRMFDPEQFPAGRHVPGKGFVPTTSIEEIEQQVTKSLETQGHLDQDLKAYTSAPFTRGK